MTTPGTEAVAGIPQRGGPAPASITPIQRRVLAAMATGRTRAAVAHDLGISYHSVRNHLLYAYETLGTTGLVESFHRLGWLVPS